MMVPYRRNNQLAQYIPRGTTRGVGMLTAAMPALAYALKRYLTGSARQAAPRVAAQAVQAAVRAAPAIRGRRRKGGRRKRAPMAARLRKLEREVKGQVSILTYKTDSSEAVKPSIGTALNGYRTVVSNTDIEAALAQCRFFDPAAPGTLVTASLASPTYQQQCKVAAWTRVIIKNSYMVPVVITYGVVTPKQATSVAPTTAWTNGLTDQGNPTSTSYLLSWKDSVQFNQLWYCKKFYTKTLLPGQTLVVKHNQAPFVYDPAYVDTETESFNKRTKTALVVYRVRGVLSHDTSAAQIGIGQCGIDVQQFSTYRIYYNSGGASVKTVVINQTAASTFTNGAVTGMTDIPDNVAFSTA